MNEYSTWTALGHEAAEELGRAVVSHTAMNSPHEGYAVLLEELDELWDEVRALKPGADLRAMRKEAIQVAAMALRFVHDVCDDSMWAQEYYSTRESVVPIAHDDEIPF